MSIGISEEHRDLAGSLREWAAGLEGPAAARAADTDPDATFADAWKAVGEMGIASIALPESVGGGGGEVLDLAVALEACAHQLVPGALLGPAVASLVLGSVARSVGPEAAVGLVIGDTAWDTPSATHFLVAGDEGDAWSIVPRGACTVTSHVGLDLTRRFGTVTVDSTVDADDVLGVDAETLRRAVVTLAAAEASGVARWCLDTAVDYAKVREQFGQKIGAFQAVKHLCAEMLEQAEAVTAAAWDAANAAHGDQWGFAVDVAAATCFDAAVEVAKSCVQVLGGIGFTYEHDAHFYLRRALSLRALAGASDDAALRLTDAAADGTRRSVSLDLDGADDVLRPEIRAEVERVAALPEEELRAALADNGYLAPHYPAPYGLGADAVTQLVLDQELARAGVSRPDIVIAAWALPTILEFGTDEQRERFVRPSMVGDLVWCQLFSEPSSGSDLASLRTKATKVDGGWRLSGQKVWNSVAERADWGICLARTNPDAPQHKGITYFLVDMRSEGIDVRPLREITGHALFNEVFLDDVFVPDDCVVGQVDDGWRLARATLANERVAMASSRLDKSTERAVRLAADGQLSVQQRVAVGHSVALSTVCTLLGIRTTLRTLAGQGPGAESSVAKLLGVRNRQDSSELVVTLLGDRLLSSPDDEDVAAAVWEMLNTRCLSIAGGTTQILRNVVGERILGLPRG